MYLFWRRICIFSQHDTLTEFCIWDVPQRLPAVSWPLLAQVETWLLKKWPLTIHFPPHVTFKSRVVWCISTVRGCRWLYFPIDTFLLLDWTHVKMHRAEGTDTRSVFGQTHFAKWSVFIVFCILFTSLAFKLDLYIGSNKWQSCQEASTCIKVLSSHIICSVLLCFAVEKHLRPHMKVYFH